jgi:NADH-quinone oxidoreductase subunit F
MRWIYTSPQPVAGGVLAFGIPEYRLPMDVLAQEVGTIEQQGVNYYAEHRSGKRH